MYKVWLKKVIIFFALALVLVSVFYKYLVIDRVFYSATFFLPENITTLVVGASHLQVGFDDSKHEHIANYSNSGMPYFFTYPKVKKLLANNSQITKLVISFSPIHVSPYGDSVFFTDKGLSRENAFNFFPLLDSYDVLGRRRFSVDFLLTYLKYRLGMPFNYMEDMKPFLISLKREIHFSDLTFGGSYQPTDQNNTKKKFIKQKAEFYFGENIQYSDLSIYAIEKIAALTQEKDVELYVLNMPVFDYFKSLVPKEYVDEQNKIMDRLITAYPNVKYYDYYNFPLLEEDFYDGDHINVRGVDKLSKQMEKDSLLNK